MYLAELIDVGAAADVFNLPHHPYTEALLSSIPRLDSEKQRERIPLRGSMPSLSEPPSGCRFHTRLRSQRADQPAPEPADASDVPPWRRGATSDPLVWA